MSNEYLIEIAKIAVGVIVSILLFVSTYRKTIGAKKERVANANKDIQKILIRRIALENYAPTLIDVSRLLEGKARDYQVDRGNLYSEEQTLNSIYTRIVESELLTSSQREEIIGRIEPFLNQIEGGAVHDDESEPKPHESIFRTGAMYVTFMAGTSSILGGIVAYAPELVQASSSTDDFAKAFFGTVAISAAIIAIIVLYFRIKSSQEKISTKYQELEQYSRFEESMGKLIKDLSLKMHHTTVGHGGGDFVIDLDEKRILIELKSWTRQVPITVLENLIAQLSNAIELENVDEAIVVTPSPISVPEGLFSKTSIKHMSIKQLRDYLVHYPKKLSV